MPQPILQDPGLSFLAWLCVRGITVLQTHGAGSTLVFVFFYFLCRVYLIANYLAYWMLLGSECFQNTDGIHWVVSLNVGMQTCAHKGKWQVLLWQETSHFQVIVDSRFPRGACFVDTSVMVSVSVSEPLNPCCLWVASTADREHYMSPLISDKTKFPTCIIVMRQSTFSASSVSGHCSMCLGSSVSC